MSTLSTDWGMGKYSKADKALANWTIGQNVSGKLGNQFSLTMGEATSAVFGWSNSITVGNKIDLICDPTSLLSAYPPLAILRSLMFGRNEYIMAAKNGFVLLDQTSVLMSKKTDIMVGDDPAKNISKAAAKAVNGWCHATNIAVTVGLLYLGLAGQAISKHYADKGGTGEAWASGINTAALTITGIIAVSSLFMVQIIFIAGVKTSDVLELMAHPFVPLLLVVGLLVGIGFLIKWLEDNIVGALANIALLAALFGIMFGAAVGIDQN